MPTNNAPLRRVGHRTAPRRVRAFDATETRTVADPTGRAPPDSLAGRGTIRVLVAAADLFTREGIAALLGTDGQLVVTGMCDGTALPTVGRYGHPDVCVVVSPTGSSGGVDQLARTGNDRGAPGLVLVATEPDTECATAFAHGEYAGAYLLRENVADGAQLTNAVRVVHAGGSMLDPAVVTQARPARRHGKAAGFADLTPRETEVLAEVAAGRSNAAIGRRLGITERSVEKHTRAIFQSLNLEPDRDTNRRVAAAVFFHSCRNSTDG